MELWVRTQDKECLTKVKHLYVYKNNNNLYEINQENDIALGKYKTKKRALEVLDTIETTVLIAGIDYKEIPDDGKEMLKKNKNIRVNIVSMVAIVDMPEE